MRSLSASACTAIFFCAAHIRAPTLYAHPLLPAWHSGTGNLQRRMRDDYWPGGDTNMRWHWPPRPASPLSISSTLASSGSGSELRVSLPVSCCANICSYKRLPIGGGGPRGSGFARGAIFIVGQCCGRRDNRERDTADSSNNTSWYCPPSRRRGERSYLAPRTHTSRVPGSPLSSSYSEDEWRANTPLTLSRQIPRRCTPGCARDLHSRLTFQSLSRFSPSRASSCGGTGHHDLLLPYPSHFPQHLLHARTLSMAVSALPEAVGHDRRVGGYDGGQMPPVSHRNSPMTAERRKNH